MDSFAIQSKEHKDLLDVIDKLRARGFGKYVDLPEIVVCGDQSAGKSSVLEAISGMTFPTKDNLCTRFATELILRRQPAKAVKISITPGPERSVQEIETLRNFIVAVDVDKPDVGTIVEDAKSAMGLSNDKVFSTDILRMELCGPDQPNLTLVDLPGLFRAGNRDQKLQDADIVRSMVQGYVKRPRSIILAVVSAKSDFALQEITELAREHDPKGLRTLGLITKPDTLDAGSDSEAAYLALAKNKDVKFRLGWHVLKNRDYEMRGASSAERDEAELRFFATGAWTSVDSSHLGVSTLKPRLSYVLRSQILQQIPSLLEDVAKETNECRLELERLGVSRSTVAEQRTYLLQISRGFTSLMRDAVNGEYNDPFFGSARTEEGYSRRFRARVQNALDDFAEQMRLYGRKHILVDELSSDDKGHSNRELLRSDYIQDVKILMKKSRGRELPGTFNPLIIGELFREQCEPWRDLVETVKQRILQATDEVTGAIVRHLAAEETACGIISVINVTGAKFREELDRQLDTLLEPHTQGHPITYNHYLIDNVQKAQEERRQQKLIEALQGILGHDCTGKGVVREIEPYVVINKLKKRTQVDMELHASELATDYMEAYYKVASKKFIDDVSVLGLEHRLVRLLSSLFEAEAISNLEDHEYARLAKESPEAGVRRAQSTDKLAVLEAGRNELKRLDAHRSLDPGHHMPSYDEASDDEPLVSSRLNHDGSSSVSSRSASSCGDEAAISTAEQQSGSVAVEKNNSEWNWPTKHTSAKPEVDFWGTFQGRAESPAVRKTKKGRRTAGI